MSEMISAREFLERVQRGQVACPQLESYLVHLIAPNARFFAESVLEYASHSSCLVDLPRIDPDVLADHAKDFHQQAGTYTPGVAQSLSAIRDGSALLLAAHQPNLFPSLGVVSQLILLDAVAKLARRSM